MEFCIIDLLEDEFNGVKFFLCVVEEVFYIDENDVDDEVIEGLDFKFEVVENVRLFNLLFIVDKIVRC